MEVHRCRFVDFQSAAITALAFSHHSNPAQPASEHVRLAVGRGNGDIEIWNPKYNWIQERIIKGGKSRSIEGLVWVVEDDGTLRLFSIGSSTSVTEWDIVKGKALSSVDCNAGPIWCIASTPSHRNLALGCDDGSVVLIDVSDGVGSMEYKRILQRQRSRILSIAWKDNGTKLVAGCSDSTVRIWDVEDRHGRIIASMKSDKANGQDTLIWSVIVLNDNTIVSGDSLGCVKFWHRKHHALIQSFKLHEADVLCLAATADGQRLFSAGIDQKTITYGRTTGNGQRWTHLNGRRYHDHDVRAMTIYEGRNFRALVTGGVDLGLSIVNILDKDAFHRKIPYPPQQPPLCLASGARMIALWEGNEVRIWKLEEIEHTAEGTEQISKHRVATIKVKEEGYISCCSMDKSGTHLAIACGKMVKLFHIQPDLDSVQIEQIEHPSFLHYAAQLVLLSEDSSILAVATQDGDVVLLNIKADFVSTDLPRYNSPNTFISHLQMSPDSKIIAIAYSDATIRLFDIKSAALKSQLPRPPNPVSAMSFAPSRSSFVVCTAANDLLEYHYKDSTLSSWSKKNSHSLPLEFLRIKDKASGIFFDETNPTRCWLWGPTYLAYFDLAHDLPDQRATKRAREQDSHPTTNGNRANKRAKGGPTNSATRNHAREIESDGDNVTEIPQVNGTAKPSKTPPFFKIILKYRPMLFASCIGNRELLVVERPLYDMHLPPAFRRHEYGQS